MADLCTIRRGLVELLSGVALSGVGHGSQETHLRELATESAVVPGFIADHGTFLVEWVRTTYDQRRRDRTGATTSYEVAIFASVRAILREQTLDVDDGIEIVERARLALQAEVPWGQVTVTEARSMGVSDSGTTWQGTIIVTVQHGVGG